MAMRVMRLVAQFSALTFAVVLAACGHQSVAPDAVSSEANAASRCAAIMQEAAGALHVRQAQLVADGVVRLPFPPGATLQAAPHCLVQGAINPRIGAGGRSFEIGFELRLPVDWNGRFVFQGGGGLDGFVQPALGPASSDGAVALAQGFAVVSTDAGHQGGDASFAADEQARIDYAYNALHVVAEAASGLVTRFYGRPADYSYFVGCSNGGRQGMIAAQRFPDLFDGIVAGNPGFRLSRAAVGEVWDNAQFARVAPRDGAGAPVMAAAFTDAELRLVADAVAADCDALDGLADGLIHRFEACRFDPARLACRGPSSANCLSAARVAALHAIFGGARDSAGRQLYAPWPYDTGIAEAGWRMWKLGNAPAGAPANGINQTLGLDAFARYFAMPAQSNFDFQNFDFDLAADLVAQTGLINDAVSTDLSSFKASSGKMIIYQGVSDPVFSAADITDWYREAGASEDLSSSVRLFMAPGMTHCGGGFATDQFDAFKSLRDWVEEGRAPDRIIAAGSRLPGVTRPLCAFPAYAHYMAGDPNRAESFECRAP